MSPTRAADPPVQLDGVELVIDGDPTPLPGGAEIALINNRYRVTWPDGTTLEAGRRVGDAWTFGLGEARWGNTIGMLGNANGNNQDDLFARDGAAFEYTDDTFYSVFGASWLLDADSTLFLTALDSDQGLPIIPGAPITLADLTAEEIAFGEAACRLAGVREGAGLAECIFDVGLTGDVRWIEGYADIDALVLRSISVQASMLLLEDDITVTVPGTLEGSIDGTSTTDIFRFDLVEGSSIFIDGGLDCPSDFGFEFTLEAPSGFFVGTSRGNGCGELGLYDLPETGEYSLRVYDAAGFTGDYSLEVALPAIVEGRIELDQIIVDNIGAFGETNHVFSISEPTSVYLDWIGCHTISDPVWELIGPDGVVVESGNCGRFVNRTFDDLTPGDWTLRVFSEGTSGEYSFRLYEILDDESFDIEVDVPVAGEMTSPRQTHRFTFDVSEPDGLYYLDVTSCLQLVHEITVTAPDGTVAVDGADCRGRDLLLDTPGEWTLEIFAENEAFRPYQFEIIDVADPQTRTINVDEPVTGTFPTARSTIEHTFTVPEGHDGNYYFDFDGCSTLGVDRTVTGPDGTLIGNAGQRCTSGAVKLDQPGEWTILLQTNQLASDYEFQIEDIADPQTRAINVEETVAGSLTTALATITHTFTVPEGHDGRYYFDFGGCPRFNVNRTVTAPDGTILGRTLEDCTSGVVQLDQPGEWTILLQSDNAARDYEFTIRDIADTTTTAIDLGETVAGTFATRSEIDQFTFNIADSGSYDIDVIACSRFGLNAVVTLTAPDGTVVSNRARCLDQTFTGQPGEWTLSIESTNEPSSYELQVIATP